MSGLFAALWISPLLLPASASVCPTDLSRSARGSLITQMVQIKARCTFILYTQVVCFIKYRRNFSGLRETARRCVVLRHVCTYRDFYAYTNSGRALWWLITAVMSVSFYSKLFIFVSHSTMIGTPPGETDAAAVDRHTTTASQLGPIIKATPTLVGEAFIFYL